MSTTGARAAEDARAAAESYAEVADLAIRALAGAPLRVVREEAEALVRTLSGDGPDPSGGETRLLGKVTALVAAAARRESATTQERMLFDRAPVCIQRIDVTARIVSMNETGRRMFPSASRRVPGVSLLELVAEADRRKVAEHLSRALEGAESEFAFTGVADGAHFEARFIPVLGEAGEVTSLVGVTNDVTASRRAEEALRQAQKMEAIGRLAGGIAHDFNNLLTAISGYVDFALAGEASGGVKRGDLEEIRRAADRAASLTRQLLAFSRRQVLQPRVFDLAEVTDDMRMMLRRLIGDDVDVAHVADPGGALVRADMGQIEQVILNLALNARDAMPNGGTLTIEVGRDGPDVLLAVSDTGVGVSEEALAHIFEPFFTTKEAGKGTGLGLATVHGIVEQSGGTVRVSSVLGGGTRFEVRLPHAEDTADAAPAGEEVELLGPAGGETILLVEDESAVRELLRRSLDERGYRVLTASGGGEALRLCDDYEGPIDAIVADLVMPRMNGTDLIAQAARIRPGVQTLLMSGYATHEAVPSDGNAFIGKPFTPDDLVRKLRELLR